VPLVSDGDLIAVKSVREALRGDQVTGVDKAGLWTGTCNLVTTEVVENS